MTFTIKELKAASNAAKAWPKGTDPNAWAIVDGKESHSDYLPWSSDRLL